MKPSDKNGLPQHGAHAAGKSRPNAVPEFHGLIERRHVYDKGLPLPNHGHTQTVKPRSEAFGQPKAPVKAAAKPAPSDAGDTTSFLVSLDNSAIQLADTGLFKLPKDGSFDPSRD